MRRFEAKDLIALATAPMNPDDHWYVDAEQASQYLVANANADEIVIYASAPAVLIVGALVPTVNVTPVDGGALQNTSLCTDAAWKIQKSWNAAEGYRVYLEPPFPNDRVSALSGGETLVTRRYLSGVHKGPAVGADGKLTHPAD